MTLVDDAIEVAFTHSLQFMNKTALNYASAYQLISDLGLEGQRYSWVMAVFPSSSMSAMGRMIDTECC